MAWATIGDLQDVDRYNNPDGTDPVFNIPANGEWDGDGNFKKISLFYDKDVLRVLNQNGAVSIRFVNTYLSTEDGAANPDAITNPIPLTFLVACDVLGYCLNARNKEVAISCPPVYRKTNLGDPPHQYQPGEQIGQYGLNRISKNDYPE